MTSFSVFPLKTMRFQMSPFSIVFNGNTNPKTETFHTVSYENGVMETGPQLAMQFVSLFCRYACVHRIIWDNT